ncbi:MAG: hypothetical protein A3H96_03100 [Acidobacteria bacterium RIFCSPLOWO2_02_FULL_67_36]|nr:MAG: hypothetical protein A3H96_03100 [Acidobacteria bacterium RIFCSPLOWO2_02_FULL_67_36]OFW25188.1 MAG: hypothetical protein A3G21_09120 [Acidobacteria bacterium RIFCSPLOWO2_12_FULL_66_21]
MIAAAALLSLPPAAQAAQRPAGAPASQPSAEQPAPRLISDTDAEQTREKLNEVLGKYPPSLGRVLKLDPSLLSNDAYLATYPALAAFLAQHPEVAHNPGYFLERVNVSSGYGTRDPRELQVQHMDRLIGDFTAFMVFLVVTGVLIWLIRMVVDSRRWSRLSKVQFDVHTKLLDRFASSEELMAYIQTPAGRKFLESAPIQVHDDARPLGAPLSRILVSLQAGVVLAIAGLGVLLVSLRFVDEPAQFFFVVGIVTMALGVGFIVSAGAAYGLSRKLGLLERPTTDNA